MPEPTKAQLLAENEALREALADAQGQQRVTSEILRVIATAPGHLQPVLDAVVRSAERLCETLDAAIFLRDGTLVRLVAHHGTIAPIVPVGSEVDAGPGTLHGCAIAEGRTIHVPDLQLAADEFPVSSARARRLDWRATLAVPLRSGQAVIGTIAVRRVEARPVSDSQIELLKTFADQAVIAIENVRLFTELQEKNRALTEAHARVTEALDQQTATSDILRVISSSPTDVQPVFDSIVKSAVQLCGAAQGVLFQEDGGMVRLAAHHNFTDEARTVMETFFPAPVGGPLPAAQVISSGETLHVADVQTASGVATQTQRVGKLLGFRNYLIVPMMLHGRAIGALSVGRRESGLLSQSQVELLQTFADQAVIAIENVRLFTELQASNRDLTTALDTQTATADILRVISRSQTDVQPVFDAIVASAVRLLRGYSGALTRVVGTQIVLGALTSTDDAGNAALRSIFPQSLESSGPYAQALRDRAPVNVADADTDRRLPERARAVARARGHSSWAVVPMLRDDEAIGTISVTRREPGGFTDDEIELLKTFADQAVIAIENVRLFTELQTSNRELTTALDTQTATSDILRVISRSQTNLQPVFDAIAETALRLCGAAFGAVHRFDGELIHIAAHAGTTPEESEAARRIFPLRARHGGPGLSRVVLDRTMVHIADVRADLEWREAGPATRALTPIAGYRTFLAVPLLRGDLCLGTINVWRRDVSPFSEQQVDLLKTFADQAVIAIENARLLSELQTSNRHLEVASQHKSEFLASMSHELRTPLNAVIGFSDVLLQGMFGEMNEKQTEYQRDILASGQHLLSLINDILDLSKIEAGRMDLDLDVFHLPTAIDDAMLLMRERASRRGLTLERRVDERLGQIRADQRKVKQVLLNLLSNAVKFTPEGGRIDVRAALANGSVEISVTDTGIGIAAEDHDAVFEEFKQVGKAEKKAEGTGLGLALCRKFVELHGGRIWVKSEIGAGSTFTFSIPVGVAPVSG